MPYAKQSNICQCYPARLKEARARWLGKLAVSESLLERVSRPGKAGEGCKKHERGVSANLRCKKLNLQGLTDPARLKEARARWLGELAVQEIKLARVNRPSKVARGTSEVARRTCDTRQGYKRHEVGGSANLRSKKVMSHGLADPARLHDARARWLGELAVQESKLAWVSIPDKVVRGTSEVARRTFGVGKPGKVAKGTSEVLRRRKVISHGLADPAGLKEARARWLGELAVQESKLSRVSRPGKVASGTSETRQGCKRHEQGGSANLQCKKLNSHGLTDPARLKEARARWLGELAMQESKLAWISRPDPASLQEAQARWLGELAAMESKLAPTREGCKRHERGGSVNLRCRKVYSNGLADPARLQEARARWLGELKVHENKLAGVSIPDMVARGKSEVAQRTCDTRQGCKRHELGGSANLRCRKVSWHGLAYPARLQEARARWLRELAVTESKLARTGQSCKRHERGGSAILQCEKVNSHGLANPARLQEARARWLGELAMQESKLARISRTGKVARGTREVPQLTCGARKYSRTGRGPGKTGQGCKMQEGGGSANFRCQKLNSHGLADPAMLQEARAKWLGELAMQESKLARISRTGKVARGTREVPQLTCGARKYSRTGRGPGKVEIGTCEVAWRTCGAGK
ncbi:hypothetical protein CDL15_Pgr002283 [Punica granatum]|uniref:Uncharacterized protein n=1 Tax=Punica granatum TaxID=22663 RepID=A0A218XHX5_PUNGR|nr:hypothetical protein CDL15_Pgr002283 [Punica granatum]